MQRRTCQATVFVFLAMLAWPAPAAAQLVHYVDNIGTCNGGLPCYSTINDALNAAVPYDSIEVFPGVYHEGVLFNNTAKANIALRAQSKARPPVITGGVSIWQAANVQVLNLILEGGLELGTHSGSNAIIEGNLIRAGDITTAPVGTSGCTVRNNTLLHGSISGGTSSSCLIEGNTVNDGWIRIGGDDPTANNVIRRNVVRGGGIRLFDVHGKLKNNTVEGNFVSGSPGDGIKADGAQDFTGINNVFRNNTSIENAGCDISDTPTSALPEPTENIWRNNRFGTKCGNATD